MMQPLTEDLRGDTAVRFHVHVVVGDKTTEFFDYLRSNYRSLAKRPQDISFYCYALGPRCYERYASASDVAEAHAVYKWAHSYRRETLREWYVFLKAMLIRRPALGGSNGHAAGLNAAGRQLRRLRGIHVFADADTAMLMFGWDQCIRNLLTNYDIAGVPYEDIGGYSSGPGLVQTYKRIPNAVWMAWPDRLDLSGINWFPAKEKNISIETDIQSKAYNLPVGYVLVRDVGWELPGFLADGEYSYCAFRHVKPSSLDCKVLKTGFDYHEEYQYEGEPIVGHHRGSHRHGFRRSEMSNAFFDAVEAYLSLRAQDKASV